MAIYTKRGDKGETGLFFKGTSKETRISKNSLRIEAIGSVDEANTSLGLAISFIKQKKLKEKIIAIQKNLFVIGAILAGAKLKLNLNLTKEMEKEIDGMDRHLPVLSHFILPGGGKGASFLFMARTFIRKTERKVVSLSKKEKVPFEVLVYLNRLSDYVYTLARYSNLKDGIKEEVWKVAS